MKFLNEIVCVYSCLDMAIERPYAPTRTTSIRRARGRNMAASARLRKRACDDTLSMGSFCVNNTINS